MIIRIQLIFILLTTVAWTGGERRRTRMRGGSLLTPRERSNVFWSRNRGEANTSPNATTIISPTTTTISTATEEIPATSNPPIESSPSSFFTTDQLTSKTLIMPTNESISKFMFWPPSQNVSVTLYVSLENKSNFTTSLDTILAEHWHFIDLYHPTEYRNYSQLYLYTEKSNLKLDRVIQMQVSSNETTYWYYCLQGNICTLFSPVQYVSDASNATPYLLAPLIVVVVLLIVSLSALAVVIFHKRSELFHIYAKPVDCITHTVPPPLPSPNPCPSPRHSNIENTQDTYENTKEKTGQQKNDERGNKNSLIIPGYNKLIQDKVKETENCLYGLV